MKRPRSLVWLVCGAAVLIPAVGAAQSSCGPGVGLTPVRTIRAADLPQTANPAAPAADLQLAPGEVVLTFDDGPVAGSTQRVIDILSKACAKATFFVIGRRVEQNLALVREARNKGHTIGSHTLSHADLQKLAPEAAAGEIEAGQAAAAKAVGASPQLFRYPAWRRTAETDAFLASRNLRAVYADISPEDWRNEPAAVSFERARTLLEKRGRGVIVLHDAQSNTPELLERLIAHLVGNGFRLVHLTGD